MLVHRYMDIDLALVADAIGTLLDLLPRYLREVARWVKSLPTS